MNRGRKPRANHTHPRRPNARTLRPITPPRPAVLLAGGPLAGCVVRVDGHIADSCTMAVPGHSGRYVRFDGDEWTWETNHRPDPEGPPMPHPPPTTVEDARPTELLTSGTRRDWQPGDRCNACGSSRTVWSPDTGAACLDCHRTDADE